MSDEEIKSIEKMREKWAKEDTKRRGEILQRILHGTSPGKKKSDNVYFVCWPC